MLQIVLMSPLIYRKFDFSFTSFKRKENEPNDCKNLQLKYSENHWNIEEIH